MKQESASLEWNDRYGLRLEPKFTERYFELRVPRNIFYEI